jgi:hypothetical protein
MREATAMLADGDDAPRAPCHATRWRWGLDFDRSSAGERDVARTTSRSAARRSRAGRGPHAVRRMDWVTGEDRLRYGYAK